jgi:hypothetical protein
LGCEFKVIIAEFAVEENEISTGETRGCVVHAWRGAKGLEIETRHVIIMDINRWFCGN